MVTCVARKLRVQYPGALYHVMNRGDRREPIFWDDADRQSFLATLGEVCVKTGWQVHAYCLMPNHFRLALRRGIPGIGGGRSQADCGPGVKAAQMGCEEFGRAA